MACRRRDFLDSKHNLVTPMQVELKRAILEHRVGLLRGHTENVGPSEGFARELQKAESELAALGQEQPPRGS